MARERRVCGWAPIALGARVAALCAATVMMAATTATAATATPAAPTALDRFLSGLDTLKTAFRQSVTDNHGVQVSAGSGQLLVQRPGKFRWDYVPDGPASASVGTAPGAVEARGQLLIADGANLWFYDRELAQVTVKPVQAALSSTPIMLLSGSVAQLHDSFDINPAGNRDGFDWVEVKPRSSEADFTRAELGFAGERLARMIVNDRLGQKVELDFSHSERNGRLDPAALRFVPPAGVDVIGNPQG
jgi:outer membrane lipoprotein carrier protein